MGIKMGKFGQFMNYLRWRRKYIKTIQKYPVKVMTFEETLNQIISTKCSVTRYGDGELRMMLSDDHEQTFEINSKELAGRLKAVIKSGDEKLLVCLPNVYTDMLDMRIMAKIIWMGEVNLGLPRYYKYLNHNYQYGNAFITRPYHDYLLSTKEVENRIALLKKLWHNRPILIVEGRLTRFGMGNDLLDNASQIARIVGPEKNAFESYDDIYDAVSRYIKSIADSDLLVLIALGPAATVMAANISQDFKVQAVDIGHLDIEYEWFNMRVIDKVQVKGKYVNEAMGEKYIDGEVDQTYLKSIYCYIN